MRTKRAVQARQLIGTKQRDDKQFLLVFQNTWGIMQAEGRETLAVLTPAELADALGSVRAVNIKDDDDMRALVRVSRMLREME
jgi:hypothetical protein